MPVKSSFKISGIDAYLETLARSGEDIDQVTADVLGEAREPTGGRIYHHLRRTSESWTGEMAKSIDVSPVQQDGNFVWFNMLVKDPGAFHKEFGRPRQAAEPFLRPAMTYARKDIRRLLKLTLDRIGA